ncbi:MULTISPECIES: cytochrome b [Candidatus Ichthyocystis]|uniref:Cytochrome b n=1 Tax=Candidatus Ichthyocystis hellenicum TaxID=1561003 RepID=A0A0S4M4E8_9BURK|nr:MULTISPECIES: cytochrome bc complex cytochrome b subunit [Ichthyocystis]CUT17149.1 Cytochrome b [Candidatus Ichthyocystis hellenicum]
MALNGSDDRVGFSSWINRRLPVASFVKKHLTGYYAPKNFNFWYFFGSLALVVLAIQVITGIFLVMHYKPDASLNFAGIPRAFASVDYIMREVPFGWLIRYMHSTGASMFFVVVYCHMFRGLLYGSYREPRELIWIFGSLIFLCLMAEAFFGYLLPWGQMSYWGAQVIVNLFSAIPLIGDDLSLWIRGDYVIGDATLNRFFSFHVIAIPLVLIGLVIAHLAALHEVGSNNPDGVEIKNCKDDKGLPLDGIPFHPYYTVKDLFGAAVFLIIFFLVVFFVPEMGGYFLEANNFIPANPMQTPPHIAPVWYFTPFYSILRATTTDFLWRVAVAGLVYIVLSWRLLGSFISRFIVVAIWVAMLVGFKYVDAKFWGVLLMGVSVIILFFLPWLDCSPVRSIRYRPSWHMLLYFLFVFSFFALGFLGVQPPNPVSQVVSQVLSLGYLSFFFLMPWWSRKGRFKSVPTRVTD